MLKFWQCGYGRWMPQKQRDHRLFDVCALCLEKLKENVQTEDLLALYP